MILIAHRANINGPNEDQENKPESILFALNKGFDVEIDLRFKGGDFYLGHDEPQYKIEYNFIENLKEHLWIHCKDILTLYTLQLLDKKNELNYFFHQNDDMALTSKGYIWTFPDSSLLITKKSILVINNINNKILSCVPDVYGICSDYL